MFPIKFRSFVLVALKRLEQNAYLPWFVEEIYLTVGLIIGICLSITISKVAYPFGAIVTSIALVVLCVVLWQLPIRKTQPVLWLVLAAMGIHYAISLFITPIISDYYTQTSGNDSVRYVEVGKELAALIARDPSFALGLFTKGATFSVTVNTPSAFQWLVTLFALASGGTGYGIGVMCAWLGTLGSYHFLQTYRSLKFESNWEWYALLVLFFPSLLFWTTLPLKDVLTFWILSIIVFNLASYFQRRSYVTLIKIVAAEMACFAIRPYYCVFITIPVIIWCMWEVTQSWRNRLRLPSTLWLLGANVLLLYFLATNDFFLGIAINASDVGDFATRYQAEAAGELGSRRIATSTLRPPTIQPGSPGFSLQAYIVERVQFAFAVLYRPLPWEAHNRFALMSSLENTALLLLSLLTVLRFKHVFTLSWRSPVLWFAAIFAFLFVSAFSFQVFNLGTMARARTNVLPFLLFFFSIALDSIYPAKRMTQRLFA